MQATQGYRYKCATLGPWMDNGGNSVFSWQLKAAAVQQMLLCFRYVERCGEHA
jgi:hypothetical protein